MAVCVYRIVGEEEERGHVQQQNTDLRKQVQQLEAALQELGREHQTLQVSVGHKECIVLCTYTSI